MTTAIYKRVSTKSQDTQSQARALDAYRAQLEQRGEAVVEFEDHFTGKTMKRPGWEKLWAEACAGRVDRIVVWRLDRLGRTVSGLASVFEEMTDRGVRLVSLSDGFDLGTAAGRLTAHVLASVAAFELEIRRERQQAGIAAARARHGGRCPWGGSKPGTRRKVTKEKERYVREAAAAGTPVAQIARVIGVTRRTVYKALGRAQGS